MDIEKANTYLEIAFGRTVLAPFYFSKVRALNLTKNDVVLDFGCGTGNFARHAVRTARKIICLDISKDKMSYVEKALGRYRNTEFHNKPLSDVKLNSDITAICIIYVLHDFGKRELNETAMRMYSVAEQGCRVYITEPSKEHHGIKPELVADAFENAGFVKTMQKIRKNSFSLGFVK
ncbi:MAG TPA: class I SAM-dependent methyltransferase [Clostridia bacterium]|nr:class I SAM-dependent methyltransferase [Clostridia bacterium]HPQ47306.1 class I SAM-dependent methyltransferase [Clostridia bacterium]